MGLLEDRDLHGILRHRGARRQQVRGEVGVQGAGPGTLRVPRH